VLCFETVLYPFIWQHALTLFEVQANTHAHMTTHIQANSHTQHIQHTQVVQLQGVHNGSIPSCSYSTPHSSHRYVISHMASLNLIAMTKYTVCISFEVFASNLVIVLNTEGPSHSY